MKKLIVLTVLLSTLLASCNSSKPANSSTSNVDAATPVTPNSSETTEELIGTWELISTISEPTPFNKLYPNTKPTIKFEGRPKQVEGNTSCNTFTGIYTIDRNSISFGTGLTYTKMACDGNGETVFMTRLNKANKYFIKDETTLMLLDGDIALLEFKKTMVGSSY